MIRILYVNGGLMNRGGIESYMMNYYRHFDHRKVQVDFIVHDAGGYGYYDEEIKKMGGQIFVLPKKSTHPFSYIYKLKKILRGGNYKIIHTHMDAMGTWVLKAAKECKIPVRIAHSHNTQHLTTNPLKLFFLEKARRNINKYANYRMACSEVAGKWLFGNFPFTVVYNAIETDKYKFDKTFRKEVRKEYEIHDHDFLIGHVGRFDSQKNHIFLIDFFSEIVKVLPNCKLMLVGEGHLIEVVKKKIHELHLNDNVIFIGVRDDVFKYYNAFDLFVLPSLFEGLPVVAIEAEANSCPAMLSAEITKEVKIVANVSFVELNEKLWASNIVSFIENYTGREEANVDIGESGYDIKNEARKLQNFYIDLWNKN